MWARSSWRCAAHTAALMAVCNVDGYICSTGRVCVWAGHRRLGGCGSWECAPCQYVAEIFGALRVAHHPGRSVLRPHVHQWYQRHRNVTWPCHLHVARHPEGAEQVRRHGPLAAMPASPHAPAGLCSDHAQVRDMGGSLVSCPHIYSSGSPRQQRGVIQAWCMSAMVPSSLINALQSIKCISSPDQHLDVP